MDAKQILARFTAILVACLTLQSCALEKSVLNYGSFRFSIDSSLVDAHDTKADAVRDPNGTITRFARDTILFRPKDAADLSSFLQRYGATVISDPTRRAPSKAGRPSPPAGLYRLHIDPSKSALGDFAQSMQSTRLRGKYAFSSADSARLTALVAREIRAQAVIGLDPVFYGGEVWNTTHVLEGPLNGTTLDYAAQPAATSTLDLQHGMLGIGVVRAWDYLEYKGIPFGSTWSRPAIAFIDGGFALDTNTGAPLNGNLDFNNGATPVVQISESNDVVTQNAGGENQDWCTGLKHCKWHGTEVFSVAAATPNNGFGVAGSSGGIAESYFIKVNGFFGSDVSLGIVDAARLEPPPAVISTSLYSGSSSDFTGVFYAAAFQSMQDAVNFANGYGGSIVVGIAGNDGQTNDKQFENPPCTLDNVLCVAAIDNSGLQEQFTSGKSGFGPHVSIWAPDELLVTPTPDSGGEIGQNSAGTSLAAPFVAGIVSLMKALNPNLGFSDVRQILQATALKSPDPVVTQGYVNALGAVMAVSPNEPPTVSISYPLPNTDEPYTTALWFDATVADPEQASTVNKVGLRDTLVSWTSSIDGPLCSQILCGSIVLSPGTHTITVSVTDPFGATAQASREVHIQSPKTPPVPTIDLPTNGGTSHISQQVHLAGSAWTNYEPAIPDAELSWSSSAVSGSLGQGSSIWTALPLGNQTLTLTATDNFGNTGTASIQITVIPGDDYPTVKISQPSSMHNSIDVGQAISLEGYATDPVDGNVDGSRLIWTSDLVGKIGNGSGVNTILSPSSWCGTQHHITLTATNSHGNSDSETIEVSVGPTCPIL